METEKNPAINFDIEDFTEFLREKKGNLQCSICSATHFELSPNLYKGWYAACPVRDELSHMTTYTIPAIYCICQNCGFQMTFSPIFISEWKAEKNVK